MCGPARWRWSFQPPMTPACISSAASARRSSRAAECPKNTAQSDADRPGRARSALCRRAQGPRPLQPRHAALLDGPGAARPDPAGAGASGASARHVRAALAGAAQPDRARPPSSCSASTAPRSRVRNVDCIDGTPLAGHQALFRLDRQLSRCAQGDPETARRKELTLTALPADFPVGRAYSARPWPRPSAKQSKSAQAAAACSRAGRASRCPSSRAATSI